MKNRIPAHAAPWLIVGPLTLALLVPAPAAARVWLLLPQGSAGASTVQSRVDSAADGDTLWFRPGRYEIELTITDKSLTLIGEGGAAQVVLTHTPAFDVGKPGLITATATTPREFRAEGLTFLEGRNHNHAWGGALSLGGVQVVRVRNCVFSGNTVTASMVAASLGGALYISGASSVTLEDCQFIGNSTTGYRSGNGSGGALMASATSVEIRRCRFESNSATSGGAALVDGATTLIEDCEFRNNRANYGAALLAGGSLTLRRCSFRENSASNGTGFDFDSPGSIVSVRGAAELTDNTFVASRGDVAAVQFKGDGPFALTRSTIAFNGEAGGRFPALRLDVTAAAAVALHQNLIAFNAGPGITHTLTNQNAVGCNIIWANNPDFWRSDSFVGVNDNQASDPLFCAAGSLEAGVVANSPCLPGGEGHPEACGVIGAVIPGCAAVSVASTTWSALKARYAER